MTAFLVLAAGAGVSWLMRAAFITIVPSSKLPGRARRALEVIGPAAMAALLATELAQQLRSGTNTTPTLGAAALTGLVAWRWRNPALTVVVGILTFWILGRVTP